MCSLYIETRSLNGKVLLSWDLAHHLYVRGMQGKVAVVTNKPVELLAATRKQWIKLTRQVQRERSSTLKAARIMELSAQIGWMQRLTFSCKNPADETKADVTFSNIEFFLQAPPTCSTLYITYNVKEEELDLLTTNTEHNAVVILYR